MCAYCRHALLTCMIVSSDPLPNAPGPLPLTSKCPNAAPPPWGRPRGTFTSVITSPEPSAGRYALGLHVRYACTPGASRAAPRRITARARSSPSRTQVQRLGPLRGWAALLGGEWSSSHHLCKRLRALTEADFRQIPKVSPESAHSAFTPQHFVAKRSK